MRKLALAALMLTCASPSFGQAVVISACGSPPAPLVVGLLHNLTMDPTGYLCVTTGTTMRAAAPPDKLPPPPPTKPQLPEKP